MFALYAINDQDPDFSQVTATSDMQRTPCSMRLRLNMRRTALPRAACNDRHGMRRAKHNSQQRAQDAIQSA